MGRWTKSKVTKLTVREEQILVLICEGWTRKEMAQMMDLSPHTIHGFITRIHRKTGIHRVAQLVLWAVRQGRVDPWSPELSGGIKGHMGPSVTMTKS